jgi:hypothetical protein
MIAIMMALVTIIYNKEKQDNCIFKKTMEMMMMMIMMHK